jgi:Mn2+/Fe2+ NRAMP family transporter
MVIMLLLARRRDVMGDFTLHPGLTTVGWAATAVMVAAAAGMFATM